MTLEEAVHIAEEETGGKVLKVLETSDRWIFCFDFEVDALTGIIFCCFKNGDGLGYFFPPDEPGLLKSAIQVDLPKEPADD